MAQRKPVAILSIQGLSDGIDNRLVDELDGGTVLPQPNAQVPRSVQSYQREQSQAAAAKRAGILALLQSVKPIHKPFKRRI